MAEADDIDSKKKRRLRAPSETVREKAEKAQVAASQPTKRSKWRELLGAIWWPLGQVVRLLRWLSHKPPLKQVGHGLRWFFSLRFMRFLGKMSGITFVIGSSRELKLVTWPTPKQSRQLTVAVIIFSIIFGVLIAITDYVLNKLFKQIILKG